MLRQIYAVISRLFDGPGKKLSWVAAPFPFPFAAERPELRRHSVRAKTRPRIVLCALPTYSEIGGLQNFNRRVIRKLGERSVERDESPPLVFLRGDGRASLPRLPRIHFAPHDIALQFIGRSVWAGITKADIFVICHINLLVVAAIVRCLRPKVKILLFVHGDEVWNQSFRHMRWYEPRLAGLLTRVASVSAFTAEQMAREFNVPLGKFRLLPNAVDPITAKLVPRRDGGNRILTVSRLGGGDREKNVDKMIRAVAELREKWPGVRYEIVGDGVLRPELEALAEALGVGDIVSFLGRVDDAGLEAAYARASVFAMPSSKEGFGIVYLEAWQHGLPVVCSSQGASKEIVGDGVDGFVVDPENISAIADRLHFLLVQPQLAREMGESGRRKVEERYLDRAFRRNLDQIIDELIDAA